MIKEMCFSEATPPQIAALQRGLMGMGARLHHIMSDGSVLSDEAYKSGLGNGLVSSHDYYVGAVVKVVDLSPKKIIRARHAHGEWVQDYVVGDHVPSGEPKVPVRWEGVSDKP